MVLPLMKLGLLAFRTLSKPVANKLKRNAGIHPRFRGFIIDVAQANHRLATNMQRRLIGRATDIHIRPLNEEKAIQAATDLLGELFIFSVACGAIIFEVHRSGKSEARKEEARKKALEVRWSCFLFICITLWYTLTGTFSLLMKWLCASRDAKADRGIPLFLKEKKDDWFKFFSLRDDSFHTNIFFSGKHYC
ncbi:uncharacterized protein [Aegilops tauschii subsp. strangulata]|uniref:uncharacterized protein isoform X1 n=1 Tax=Aegilops tauschii subsp. strangulata TaxID=200361 RepID=UPI001ABBEE98